MGILLEVLSTSRGFRSRLKLLDQVRGLSVALAVLQVSYVVHMICTPTGECRARSWETVDRGVSTASGEILPEYLVAIDRA
jgi:hypothetical protein